MTDEQNHNAQPYDFRKPMRLPDDLERRLGDWQRALCPLVQEKWSQYSKAAPAWQAGSLDSLRAADALARLPESAVGYVIHIGSEPSQSLFVFPTQLVLAIVDGMLGESNEEAPEDRAMTKIEDSLARLAIEELAGAVGEAIPVAEPLPCKLVATDDRPQRIRLFGSNESVVTLTFEIGFAFGAQRCSWLLAEQDATDMFAQFMQVSPAADESGKRKLESNVRQLPVPVVVQLGNTTMHVSELAALRPGDVVVFDQRVTEPLAAQVGGRVKFHGWPGKVGSRQALRIDEFVSTQ